MHKPAESPQRSLPGDREMVVMMAMVMALNALAIDVMLPALPDIQRDFAFSNDNDRQLVIIAYVALFGVALLGLAGFARRRRR